MPPVRTAVPTDIPELVRLRTLMFAGAGAEDDRYPPARPDEWQESFADGVAGWLGGPTTRVVVIDGTGGLAACGMGVIDRRLPHPYDPAGLAGYVFGIVTDPAYRRRGHARAVTAALLDWFGERGVGRVDLRASPEGEPLYRALGFTDSPHSMLGLRL